MKAAFGFVAVLALMVPGCIYSLDVKGKACNYSDHPCPAGYVCMPAGDGGGVCKEPGDGGGDGGDVGPCLEGQRACVPGQPAKIAVCHGGFWQQETCPGANYCYYTSPEATTVNCVPPCTSSDQCHPEDFCNSAHGHCEPRGDCSPPGAKRCLFKSGYDALEECNVDSGQWIETPCGDGNYCHEKYLRCLPQCHDDGDCADLPNASNPEPNSCDLGENKCRYLSYCQNNADCSDASSSCVMVENEGGVQGVCVRQPTTVSGANMDCYKNLPSWDNGTPVTCAIEGYVIEFVRSTDRPLTPKTIGLKVQVHSLENILRGVLSEPYIEVTATEVSGNGYYQVGNVIPTRTALVFRVVGGAGQQADFVDTYTFGYYLRADECQSGIGKVNMDVPAIETSVYQSYAGAGLFITPNPKRGLILSRLRNCTPNRLANASVAVSIPNEKTFYIVTGLVADPEALTTDGVGFFGATNAQAIRGVLGALVKESTSYIYLGPYPLRVFPDSASLVLVDKPKAP